MFLIQITIFELSAYEDREFADREKHDSANIHPHLTVSNVSNR